MVASMELKINKNNIENLGDYWLSVTATIQSLILLIQVFVGDIGLVDKEVVALFRVLISGLLVFVAMFWILQRKPIATIVSYVIVLLLFIISIFLSSDNKDFVLAEGFRFTLCICLPIFLSVISIKSEMIFHRVCLLICVFCTIVGIAYGILFLLGLIPFFEKNYNMSYGYGLLFPAMYFMYRGTKILYLFSFILFMLILLCASRGALIPIILFFLWKSGVVGTSRTRFLLFLVLVFVAVFFSMLLNYLSSLGIESRTLFLLLSGEVDTDSGRDELYSIIGQKIHESPYFGYGVFGDRVFLDDGYCHNIVYELLLDFGVFASILILLFLAFLFVDSLRKQNPVSRDFIVLCCLASMLPLMVSSSYLIDFRFFFFLGVLLFYRKKRFSQGVNSLKNYE